MKELHVCVTMSDSYKEIYDKIFLGLLPDEFKSVNVLYIRDFDSEPGLVGERNFKVINYKRLQFIAKQMIMHEGDNLLVLDIDAVFFRDFKDEINTLLEDNDMVFQHSPQNRQPYCIATWGMQCSRKNMDFFHKEVLPRSEALLITKEEWDVLYKDFMNSRAPGQPHHDILSNLGVPPMWLYSVDGVPTYYDGDACVVNAAISESDLGKELNIALLPDTYTLDPRGGPRPEECVLYQCTGNQGTTEKAIALVNTYHHIKGKQDNK